MMTGNGADIECYADRENQPAQMAVRFWIARNRQLQAIQSGIIPPKCVFVVRDRVQCLHERPGEFSTRHPVHSGNCVP